MTTPRAFDAIHDPLPERTLLLEASAGTGKTWSLTTVATRLVLDGSVRSIDRLLMVTFTRAATHELRERLRARLREARDVLRGGSAEADPFLASLVDHPDRAVAARRLDDAVADFDLVRISTIHGFCARLLQDTAFEAGLAFESEETEDSSRLRATALADAWRKIVHGGAPWRAAWARSAGFDVEKAEEAFATATRRPGATWRPTGEALAVVDARAAAAFDDVFGDRATCTALADFLDASKKFKQGPHGIRLRRLAQRCREGALTADVDTWFEVLDLLPSRVDGTLGAAPQKKPAWAELAARLDGLDAALADATASLRTAVLEEAASGFERAKRAAGLRDFDDMIAETRVRLADPARGPALIARVRDAIDTALIDEFQDTDAAQWSIFSSLFAGKRLVLVGDPKQAIYSFRGADVFAYFDAKAQADARATLPRNHRSHPHLVQAVNHLFADGDDAFALEDLEAQAVEAARTIDQRTLGGDAGPALQVDWIDEDTVRALESARTGIPIEALTRLRVDAYREAATARTVEAIASLLARRPTIDGRPLNPGDVAVLTRRHRESHRVHRALRDAGIDAVIAGSGDVRTTEVYLDVVRLLDAIADPSDPRRVHRALATRLWGLPLSGFRPLLGRDDAVARAFATFEELQATLDRFGAYAVLARVVVDLRVEERWLAERDGERAVTDLRHAMEFVHTLERERGLRPDALVAALWTQHEVARTEREQDATRLRLERDERAVKIVTMHTSKGLEYDVVVVPFAWDGLATKKPWMLHEDRREILDWDADDESSTAARARAEGLAEEMRLLYVALTRATRRCVVIDTVHRAAKKLGALHHLLHRDARPPDQSLAAWIDGCMRSTEVDEARWAAAIDDLVAREGIGRLDTDRPDVEPAPVEDEAPLAVRPLPSKVVPNLQPWTVSSFTALARGVHDGGLRLREREDPEAVEARIDATPAGIFAFARGARAGNCLHEVLEHSAFDADPQDAAHRERVESILRRHDLLDPARHDGRIDPVVVVLELVTAVGAETFPGASAAFASITAAQRANEWEFRLPVDRIDLTRLADVVEEHAPAAFAADLAARLRSHQRPQVDGLFGGVVDLVFELDGRYRIVDWKSNHLGNTVEAYDPAAMRAAMLEHDYYLQMLLYQVVLHRHLRVRLSDYDYDTHCAGAAYAFLRGLCGREDRGWIAWRPERALIERVDAFFRAAAIGGTA